MANKVDAAKQEELSKAIDAIVDEQLGKEAPAPKTEEVEKAMPKTMDENGGKDKIKSGTPYSEGGNKKSPEDEGSHTKKMKKAEDETPAAENVEKAKEEKDEKDEDKKTKKAYKSVEALGDLSDEEIELVKAWREEKALEEKAETVEKSQAAPSTESLTKAITDAITSAVEPLKKAIEAKDNQIQELEKNFKKLASQPAYDKRSLSTLEPIEKSGNEQTISKAQVLNKMLDLQMQGKGVRSNHITEFETTGNISDPGIKRLVMDSFK